MAAPRRWGRWFALAVGFPFACAPAVDLRPPTPMSGDRNMEVGLGYAAVSPRPYGEEPWAQAVQGWFTFQPLPFLELLFLGGFDGTYGAGGFGGRFHLLDTDRFRLAPGLQLGVGWVALELAMAGLLARDIWLYSIPQYGNWGADRTVRLPVGLEFPLTEPSHLRVEGQVNYPELDPYQRRFHLGVGFGYQF